jgi:hypothetical protein
MRRRDFIKVIAGSAVWPIVGHAQQNQRMRRIGVLMNLGADDKEGQARLIAFAQALSDLGWKNTNNMQIETCWGAGDTGRFHQCAAELVALAPDVILAASASTMDRLLNQTRTIPIVFAQVPDPVGSGYVASLARPGGNATGFTQDRLQNREPACPAPQERHAQHPSPDRPGAAGATPPSTRKQEVTFRVCVGTRCTALGTWVLAYGRTGSGFREIRDQSPCTYAPPRLRL